MELMISLKTYTERIETSRNQDKFKIKPNLLHIILKIITKPTPNKSTKIEINNKIRFQMPLKSTSMISIPWLASMISKDTKRVKTREIHTEGEVLVIGKRIRILSKIDTKNHHQKEITHLITKVIEKLLLVKKDHIKIM